MFDRRTSIRGTTRERVNHIGKRLNSGRELRMISQIGNYRMDYIIQDLGSDVNIITRNTWEGMGKPRLV